MEDEIRSLEGRVKAIEEGRRKERKDVRAQGGKMD